MFGTDERWLVLYIATIALIIGLLFLGAEHGCGYVVRHVRIGWAK